MVDRDELLQERYRLLQQISQGGMATVYLAQDTRLDKRQVVIKRMDPHSLAPEDRGWARATFRREANLLARLDHPGLATVTDFFEENGYLYLTMEYVQGETLSAALARARRFEEAQVLAWGRELCGVLAYLHHQEPPIVFRDLKPDNIMVQPDGTLKLIDFGIARFFKQGQQSDTVALGTVGYAAPEQYGRGQTDPRADVYSLGVVLYQLLTGYDPAQTPMNLPPLLEQRPDVSPPLAAAIQQALKLDPSQRFADATAFAQALKPTAPTSVKPRQPRRLGYLLVGAGVLMLLAVAVAWWRWPSSSAALPVPPQSTPLALSRTETATAATDPLIVPSLTVTVTPIPEVTAVTPTATETPTLTPTATSPTPTPTGTAISTSNSAVVALGEPENAVSLQSTSRAALERYRTVDPLVYAFKVPLAPVIDGDLNEWATTAYPIRDLVYDDNSWSGYNDLSGVAYLAWDDTHFYLALEIVDDRFAQNATGILLYRGDSIEIWFDGDLAGDFGSARMSADDSQIGASPGHPASLIAESYQWSPSAREGPLSDQLAAARIADGYTLEWALPWDELGVSPADGAAFGFTICLSDNDVEGVQRQESMVCMHGTRRHNDPQSWGTLILIAP